MERLIKQIKFVSKRVNDHEITVYAAQATLFVIISVIPILMLIISLLKYIIPFTQMDVINLGADFLPESLHPALYTIAGEVFSGASASIISVTTIAALWSASKGMMSLIQGLESVHETTNARGYIKKRLLALVYTIVFIAIISATLLFVVAGRYFINLTAERIPAFSSVVNLIYTFPVILYVVILMAVFGVLYKMLPGGNLSFRNQLPGAAVAATGWVIFSAVYSFYVTNFADYSYLYGSLTAVVLLILWLYFCMIIFLFGAELNCFFKEGKEKGIEK